MNTPNFTTTFSVNYTPEAVFDAINNVRGWWSGEIEGDTDQLGSEFTYRYKDVHRSTQRITEFIRGKRIVWRVADGSLAFVKDKASGMTRTLFSTSLKKMARPKSALHTGASYLNTSAPGAARTRGAC